jgi:hypothetical protein
MPDLLNLARRLAVPVQGIGTVGGDRLVVAAADAPEGRPWLDVPVTTLLQAWNSISEES